MTARRLAAFPLILLRDLPIGVKLILTVVGALMLLSAVSWFALQRLAVVGALQDGVATQADRQRVVQSSLLAALELRVVSRDLQHLQTVRAVDAAVTRAEQQRDAARATLQQVLAATGTAAERELLAQAIIRLDAAAEAVKREAALRGDMLIARQKRLFQARGMFESSLRTLTDELERGGALLSGVDSVRDTSERKDGINQRDPTLQALNAYRIAMAKLQGSALMFMATGNGGAANDVREAVAETQRQMQAVMEGDAPEAVKNDAYLVDSIGSGMARAALDLIAQSRQLETMAQDEVEAATQAMQTAIDQLAAALSAGVQAASDQAAAGRIAARRDMLVIIGSLAVVLLSLGMLTTQVVAGPIRRLTHSVQAIAAGETATPVAFTDWRDETGRMAAAVETLRGVMRQTYLQSQMIEQIPVGVMTAQPSGDFNITYANAETVRLLALAKGALPVPVDQLAGHSIDLFFPDPQAIRAVAGDPGRLPHRDRLTLGNETFQVTIAAIQDARGDYAGPMLIWHRLTGQLRLAQQFEASVGAIANTIGGSAVEMRHAVQAVADAARDSEQRIVAVTEASLAASGHVSAAASGAEELAASVAEIGRQVAESAHIAKQAVREAEATDQCVGGLSEAAGRIGDVVKLISDIADSTNLLALNATIEAARAGEAGKGFAVVAGEVKTLATQTGRATHEIAAQIASMQQATGQAVTALRSIGATIQRMDEIATSIAGAAQQQGSATQDIARAVQQAAAGASEVDSNLGAVGHSASDTGSRAGSLLEAASRLGAQSDMLTKEVQAFLTAVQQAA